MINLIKTRDYFLKYFNQFGPTPQGLNWNSPEAQKVRFEQIYKVIGDSEPFSIIDYGCGYGAFIDFLKEKGRTFYYQGYDIVEDMVFKGKELHNEDLNCSLTSQESDLTKSDFVVESGIFNVKQSVSDEDWKEYIIRLLDRLNSLAAKGLACNFLTNYSDPEYMRSDLYYADPLFFFDYCKKNYSRNVALLHDYELYDFTIIVRK